ncbi:MAG TPA: helix-turn-helix domain-containing protein, partial [Burkholderiaceae bacterium]
MSQPAASTAAARLPPSAPLSPHPPDQRDARGEQLRRKALNMRQDQLAMATGVGRRFLIELEAGKPTCQLGRSLLVAEALGLRSADIL